MVPASIAHTKSKIAPKPFTLARIPGTENVWGFGAVHWSARPGDDVGIGIVTEKIAPRRGPYRDTDEDGNPTGPWNGEQDVSILKLADPSPVQPSEVLWEVPQKIQLRVFYHVEGVLQSFTSTAEFAEHDTEWLRGYWMPRPPVKMWSGGPAFDMEGNLVGVLVGSSKAKAVINSIAYCLDMFPEGWPVWPHEGVDITPQRPFMQISWKAPAPHWVLERSSNLRDWEELDYQPLGGTHIQRIGPGRQFFRLKNIKNVLDLGNHPSIVVR